MKTEGGQTSASGLSARGLGLRLGFAMKDRKGSGNHLPDSRLVWATGSRVDRERLLGTECLWLLAADGVKEEDWVPRASAVSF